MMPRVAKRMLSGGSLKTTAKPLANLSSKRTTKAVKSETADSKAVNSSSSTSTSKNKLKPSMTRDFELNICREEEQTDISSCKYSAVIGCDEAGRGPLCGPVVAAAAWVAADSLIEHGIADSKATTEAQREATYEILVNHPGVKYAVVRIEHDEIDEINILQASLKAMRLACTGVLEQLQNEEEPLDPATCLCLVDGNKCPQDMPVKTKCIIKGDSLAFSIAAASIIAKISRDRIMTAYALEYPLYGLAQHKGYPTLAHRTVLSKIGPSPIHRMSYRPVYESVKGYVKPSDSAKKKKKTQKKEAQVGKPKAAFSKTKTKITETQRSTSSERTHTEVTGAKTTTTVSATATMIQLSSNSATSSGRVTRSSTRKRKEIEMPGSAQNLFASGDSCEAVEPSNSRRKSSKMNNESKKVVKKNTRKKTRV